MSAVRNQINRAMIRLGFPRDWFLIPLAAIIGVLAGLTAKGFAWLVEFSADELFGQFFHGDFVFTGDRYLFLIMLPALGGLLVGLLSYFARGKGGGHGIPDVIESLARRQGVLPKRSMIFKAITASLTIGSGGSAGVEGPIIQIGSSLGSAVGQILNVGRTHMHALVGAGAAAGMAAIFNAPIAAVLFVLEVLLRDFSLKTFVPIVIAAVFGTAVAQAVGGSDSAHVAGQAVFSVPLELKYWEVSLSELGPFAVLGVLCGLAGVTFVRAMSLSEAFWAKVKVHPIFKPALGGAILGVIGLIYVLTCRDMSPDYHPPAFFGNGYPIIERLFEKTAYLIQAESASDLATATVALLLVTMLVKIAGTVMTVGSGGSGGVLAPSLFIGATLGGAFGLAVNHLGVFGDVHPGAYALAGMAGVLAGSVHCPLTAFLLIFEMTQDYKVILPVMLVSILATTFAQIVHRDSMYAYWLRHMGLRMGAFSDTTVLRRLYASQVRLIDAAITHPQEPAQRLLELAQSYAAADFVVCDDNEHYVGMVVGQDVRTTLLQREALPLLIVGELMRDNLPTVAPDQTLDVVLDRFAKHDVASLPVVDDNGLVLGMITHSRLMQRYQQAMEGE